MMQPMILKDVLEYLNIKRTTFYNYKKRGMPVHYSNGKNGKIFCYKEEIDEWLKGKRCEE